MKATEYVDSLIAGINMGSEIPVQLAELDMIKALIEAGLLASSPLTDDFIHKVVRSKQPYLDATCKAWKDECDECKYWLTAARGITGEEV